MVPIHFALVILLSGVLASQSVLGSSVLKSRDLLDHLLTRQHDSPIDMCEDNCNNITSTLSSCNGNQTCICTISNAQMLESCVDCVVALAPTVEVAAMGQVTLDEFNVGCQGGSIPPLVAGTSPPGSLEPVSSTANGGPNIPGLSFPVTPPSPVTQSVVTVTITTSMSVSAGSTPLYHAPGLVVVGVVAGIVLALV